MYLFFRFGVPGLARHVELAAWSRSGQGIDGDNKDCHLGQVDEKARSHQQVSSDKFKMASVNGIKMTVAVLSILVYVLIPCLRQPHGRAHFGADLWPLWP
jgi:hypothetical protein